jgi:hypothetical protein
VIIGLCGAAGSGKNAAAHHLGRRYGAAQFAFADPLYAAISAITGLSVAELQDRRRKEAELEWLPASPRRLLQTIGTEWGRETIHPEIWIMATLRRIDASEAALAVITDVRFENEAEAIRHRGGAVWHVVRPGAGLAGAEGSHSSERGIPENLVDDEVLNDGGLATLDARLDEAMTRLLNCRMK